jgi:hypothetical protein
MAKARYRTETAEVVELSLSVRAVLVDGMVLLFDGGKQVFKMTRREAEVLAAVTGTGDAVPKAIAAAKGLGTEADHDE